jgi:hypothetical protein
LLIPAWDPGECLAESGTARRRKGIPEVMEKTKSNQKRHTPRKPGETVSVELLLTLDPATHADRDAVDAMVDAFPPPLRSQVSVSTRLLASVQGTLAYLVLTITVIGPGVKWLAKKVLGPPADAIGKYLADAVTALLKRGKNPPTSITVHLELTAEQVDIRFGLATDTLLALPDPRQPFAELAVLLADALAQPVFGNAEAVFLSWDTEHKRWTFQSIWPRDMHSTGQYLAYDPNTKKWKKKNL